MKYRSFWILLCLSLCASHCTYRSNYLIKPTTTEIQTVELLSNKFNDITKVVDQWAVESNFEKTECGGQKVSPLCKGYERDYLHISVLLNTATNHIDIKIFSLGSIGADGEKAEQLLIEKLKGMNGWMIERD